MSSEIFDKGHPEKHTWWHSGLKSVDVEPKAKIGFSYGKGLGKFSKSHKQTVYQQHKVPYSDNYKEEFLTNRVSLSEIVIEGILKE
jgi:hypothetical protein